MPTIIIESEPWRFTDANNQWQTLRPLPLTKRLLFRQRWQELSQLLELIEKPEWGGEFRIKAEKLLSMVGVESGLDFAVATQLLFGIISEQGFTHGLTLLHNAIDPSNVWPVERPTIPSMSLTYDYDDVFRHSIDSSLRTWGLDPSNIDIGTAQRLIISEGEELGALFQLEFYDTGMKGEPLEVDDHPTANALASLISEHWNPLDAQRALDEIPWNPLQGALSIRADAMKKAMDEAKGEAAGGTTKGTPGKNSKARQGVRERYLNPDGSLDAEKHPEMAAGLAFLRKMKGAKRKGKPA